MLVTSDSRRRWRARPRSRRVMRSRRRRCAPSSSRSRPRRSQPMTCMAAARSCICRGMISSGALEGAELPLVPVICGPTGAGKSAVAMRLAPRIGATIIAADSRLIYRRFDIGTAKPSPADRDVVPHRGIDLVEPTERYSAAAWADAADGWIATIEERGGHPLVVDGTGFYLRALFDPLFGEPALEPGRRQALEGALGTLSLDDLIRWTRVLDPERARL